MHTALPSTQSSTTERISRSTSSSLPLLSAPMLITMSISRAPLRIARRASMALIAGSLAPSGKPTTVQVSTSLPRSSSATSETQVGFTQTERKLNSSASAHSLRIFSSVASGFSKV